jgi:hypothetical protein
MAYLLPISSVLMGTLVNRAPFTWDPTPATLFYQRVMEALADARIPYLVGGTYAMAHYTGVDRPTKDLDLFLNRDRVDDAMAAIERAGYRTELTHPHFLGKAFADPDFVDLIFSSGNGSCAVDDEWFAHAPAGTLFDMPVRFCPIEETIWSKAFVMERERFDGHDVAHLLRAGADYLDWARLLWRFGDYWRVMLAHIVLFGFIFPADRDRIPAGVTRRLTDRLFEDAPASPEALLTQGTLLSRSQYLHDLDHLGFADARLEPTGAMSREEIDLWTKAIDDPKK